MPIAIKLIVGLGNPGPEHTETRHNAGFWCIDQFAENQDVQFKQQSKFQAEVAQLRLSGKDYWLMKPQTFMNHSGRAVQAMMSFYKIDVEELLVIHDEIDLPPGTVRFKKGGGHGGQNGLRDIINSIGSPNFARLRIGVGHPGDKHKVVNHVLGRANKADQENINLAIERAVKTLPLIISGKTQKAMNELHSEPEKQNKKTNPDNE